MSRVQQNVIKHKVGLLNPMKQLAIPLDWQKTPIRRVMAAELGNVPRTCKVMGFSRDTFYRYQAAVENGGVDALINANRRTG